LLKIVLKESPEAPLSFADWIRREIAFACPAGHGAAVEAAEKRGGLFGVKESYGRSRARTRYGHALCVQLKSDVRVLRLPLRMWTGCPALHHRVGLVRSVIRKDDMGFASEVANH
jgi:hypothetical protein